MSREDVIKKFIIILLLSHNLITKILSFNINRYDYRTSIRSNSRRRPKNLIFNFCHYAECGPGGVCQNDAVIGFRCLCSKEKSFKKIPYSSNSPCLICDENSDEEKFCKDLDRKPSYKFSFMPSSGVFQECGCRKKLIRQPKSVIKFNDTTIDTEQEIPVTPSKFIMFDQELSSIVINVSTETNLRATTVAPLPKIINSLKEPENFEIYVDHKDENENDSGEIADLMSSGEEEEQHSGSGLEFVTRYNATTTVLESFSDSFGSGSGSGEELTIDDQVVISDFVDN